MTVRFVQSVLPISVGKSLADARSRSFLNVGELELNQPSSVAKVESKLANVSMTNMAARHTAVTANRMGKKLFIYIVLIQTGCSFENSSGRFVI